VKIGVVLPIGFYGEFDSWEPTRAWHRTLAVAALAQSLGFESVWTGEHLLSYGDGSGVVFGDGFTLMAAVAQAVPRVGIGYSTICAGFRNPALTAKTASQLDVISGGRLTLGLGAGWKESEFRAFGYEFPSRRQRLAGLEEQLEIITRMLATPEPVTWAGSIHHVDGAVNNPTGVRSPRVKVMVGGHGPNVTFRLAARFADELNIDITPAEVAALMPIVRERCQEIGRDPATLEVSGLLGATWPWVGINARGQVLSHPGAPRMTADSPMPVLPSRAEGIAQLLEAGATRAVAGLPGIGVSDDALFDLVRDCEAAGVSL
jgi:alkanesulfonate monooxygenase SsuD/methylene tetrahydromethanopterin reductase-like flavin-dependent oxidoreductase (luciferase family)